VSKTIKHFDYRIIKMGKGGTSPFDPYVEIILDHWIEQNNNTTIVSPNLMSETEIDERIQALKIDLDAVGKMAKAALIRAKAETLTIVSSRNSN
jgi:hypothetical protein